MRISHICHACGTELARIAAPPDPIYHLPIVVCPCGTAHVRRRHPARALWRIFFARTKVLLSLCLLCAFFLAPTAGLVGAGHALLFPAINGGPLSSIVGDNPRELIPVALTCWLIASLPALSGTLLLHHRSLAARTALFAGTSLFAACLSGLGAVLDRIDDPVHGPLWIVFVNTFAFLFGWSILTTISFALMSAFFDLLRRINPLKPTLANKVARARRRRR